MSYLVGKHEDLVSSDSTTGVGPQGSILGLEDYGVGLKE